METTGVEVPVATATGAVPVTEDTKVAAPSNFALSAALIAPSDPAVAREMLIAGVVVPVATTIGALPVTLETTVAGIASSFVLSAALIEPALAFVAGAIEITGAAPPVEAKGVVAVTPVTVPPPPPAATHAVPL
jgi:hypothetical protein